MKESGENPYSQYFQELFETKVNGRKLIKLPVMTYPYGLTQFGLIYKHFDNLEMKISKEKLKYLINLIREDKFSSDIKNFLTTVINDCTVIGWIFYITTTFNGVKGDTRLMYNTNQINRQQHMQAITANFIHAYHMR